MDRFLTTKDVAIMLRQDISTIQKWSREGILPVVRIGRRFLFEEEELKKWVEEHKVNNSSAEKVKVQAFRGPEQSEGEE